MKVSLKIYDLSVPEELKNLSFELPDGSTVDDMVRECVEIRGIPYDYTGIIGSAFIVNGSPANLSMVLSDGDKVMLMRPMEGG